MNWALALLAFIAGLIWYYWPVIVYVATIVFYIVVSAAVLFVAVGIPMAILKARRERRLQAEWEAERQIRNDAMVAEMKARREANATPTPIEPEPEGQTTMMIRCKSCNRRELLSIADVNRAKKAKQPLPEYCSDCESSEPVTEPVPIPKPKPATPLPDRTLELVIDPAPDHRRGSR